eukprot:4247921-Lingulodinium_polyedra.AAC.1
MPRSRRRKPFGCGARALPGRCRPGGCSGSGLRLSAGASTTSATISAVLASGACSSTQRRTRASTCCALPGCRSSAAQPSSVRTYLSRCAGGRRPNARIAARPLAAVPPPSRAMASCAAAVTAAATPSTAG